MAATEIAFLFRSQHEHSTPRLSFLTHILPGWRWTHGGLHEATSSATSPITAEQFLFGCKGYSTVSSLVKRFTCLADRTTPYKMHSLVKSTVFLVGGQVGTYPTKEGLRNRLVMLRVSQDYVTIVVPDSPVSIGKSYIISRNR